MFQITLKAARVNAGLTQDEAAKKAGINKTTLLNWENQKTFPRIDQLENLCAIYNIPSIDYIFLCPNGNLKANWRRLERR